MNVYRVDYMYKGGAKVISPIGSNMSYTGNSLVATDTPESAVALTKESVNKEGFVFLCPVNVKLRHTCVIIGGQ